MPRSENLQRLLSPRHVAFVGGRHAGIALQKCVDSGFEGEIWAVNPNRTEVAGYPCFASIAALPEPPDAAFVAVHREATVEVVRALADRGAGGCVCYAAGFAELGSKGAALQDALTAAAGDLALVGPNCYGLLNYLDGVTLWPDLHGGGRVRNGVAIISQSGNIALNLTMNDRSVPIALVISVGNQAVLGIGDYLAACAADPRISAIGLYVEGLNDVHAFSKAAVQAREAGVPVVALKSGRSEVGGRTALSHTSALAGSQALYSALFERLGIIEVDGLSGFLETLKLMGLGDRLSGGRLAFLTCSGGEAALAADLTAEAGLSIADLDADQVAAIKAELPVFATVANPLDYNTAIWGDTAALQRCFASMMGGAVDATVLVLDFPTAHDPAAWDAAIEAVIGARLQTGKPAFVVSSLSELLPRDARRRLIENGVIPLQGLTDGISAIAGAVRYGAFRGRPAALPRPPSTPIGETRPLDEWQSKQMLSEYGLVVPAGRLVRAGEVCDAAANIGYPVALKLIANGLTHKTDAGAVALNLSDREMLAQALGAMQARVQGDGFLVESMVAGGVAEIIVGVSRDPGFGLALLIGSGGILTELVADTAQLLLPTDGAAVARALDGLKVARLLDGYRGRPAGDRTGVIDQILAVARFAETHGDRLVELDVNPLIALPEGRGAVAADAFVNITEE